MEDSDWRPVDGCEPPVRPQGRSVEQDGAGGWDCSLWLFRVKFETLSPSSVTQRMRPLQGRLTP